MRFRLECALSLAKLKSRGWVQIKCSPAGLENCGPTGGHCCRTSRLRAGKFNNRGLFCLCYITKHLKTAPSGNICFVSFESKSLLQLHLGWASRVSGNKTDVSRRSRNLSLCPRSKPTNYCSVSKSCSHMSNLPFQKSNAWRLKMLGKEKKYEKEK